jgi:hypothetical protein
MHAEALAVIVVLSFFTVTRQRHSEHVPKAMNTSNVRRITEFFIFCTVRVVSWESMRYYFPQLLVHDFVLY